MGQYIPLEVHAAALPAGIEHAGDGRLDAFMSVADDEFHPAQPPAHQVAQEARPERLRFRGADGHAQDFPASV